jgi:hypothetical protein
MENNFCPGCSIEDKEKIVAPKEIGASVVEDAGGVGAVAVGIGEGQSLISSPVIKKDAKESYLNDGSFDEDQELALQILLDDGIDLYPVVTPDNSPEQIFELANAVKIGMPGDKVKLMADPQVSYMAIQVIIKAWKKKIDLTKYLPWADPFVLNQALLGALKGLDLDKFIKPGLDHRQIEQLRKELEAGGDPDSLIGNYNQIRAKRFPGHNISNMELHVKKGEGTSTHSKRRV